MGVAGGREWWKGKGVEGMGVAGGGRDKWVGWSVEGAVVINIVGSVSEKGWR